MNNSDRIFDLEIDLLQPNPLQPRGLISQESLSELAGSIKEHGILEPIVVAKTPAGYQIIAGERRWRASKLIGLDKVPVIIKETSPQGMLEMAIVENVQRQDLNPLERAQAYQRLMNEFGLTNGEISQRVGKSPAFISNTIKLLTLPDAIKDALMAGQTTEGHARALSALDEPYLIIEAYKEVLKRSLSVRGTEELVRRIRSKHGILAKKGANIRSMYLVNDDIDSIQNGLSQRLLRDNSKPVVKYVLSGNQAKLEIKLSGQPDNTSVTIRQIYEAITTYFDAKNNEELNGKIESTVNSDISII